MLFRRKNRPFFSKNRLDIRDEPIIRRMPFASSVTGSRRVGKWSRRLRVLFRWLLGLAIFGVLAGLIGGTIAFAWVSKDLPDPNKLIDRKVQKTTKIWDRTGQHLLYEIHGDQKRTVVQLGDIAPVMVKATIASEDKNFYTHSGFRIQSFVRAMAQAVLRGRRLQGTSTITQQVVKNVILTNERSLTRKVKELVLAYQIEQKFSKDDILQIYFNETPYGSTAYGIESAAQMYYGKSSKDLDAAESALLTAIVPAPTRLSPYGSNKKELMSRQQHILDVMREQGYLTEMEVKDAKAVDILARVKPRRENIFAPHFSIYVKEVLADEYGEAQVEQGGLNVITTLDYDKQVLAETAVKDGMEVIEQFKGSNAGLISLDPKTGQVLAMVGSRDYFEPKFGSFNVIFSKLQPGSSIKPIVYATALERGYTPDTVVFDVNTAFPTDLDEPFEPRNYDLAERGPVPMRQAIAGSLNIPAVKFLYLAGIDNVLNQVEKLGYTTVSDRSRYGLSFVLGGVEVRPIEHAAAYATFATEGSYRAPSYILKVTDAEGNMLQEWKDDPKTDILSVETSRHINQMLSDNAARAFIFGEKNYLTLGDRPAAAKTGTTNDFNDAWAMGYTPNLVAGVWVGNNDHTPMKKGADGSKVAAPIWNAYMRTALKDTPVEVFTTPLPIITGKPVLDGQGGAITINIDSVSGKLATADTPPSSIVAKTFRQAHEILYYVNKDDPRGLPPAEPDTDPQFQAWEDGVKDWAVRNNWNITEAPPTESDNVHTSADRPNVMLISPSPNEKIASRTFIIHADASGPHAIKRVEFSMEGIVIGIAKAWPWQAEVVVPSVFGKGFYTVRATAYDDLENSNYAELTINELLDGTPLAVTWLRPTADASIRASRNFPYFVDVTLSDNLVVTKVDLVASATDGAQTILGTLSKPKTQGVSATWSAPPQALGPYDLSAIVTMWNGETKTFPGPTISVKP